MEVEQEAGNERQAGHGTRAMDYGGPDFRMAVTPLAQKLGESVEGLAALASALAEANVAVLGPGSSYAVVGGGPPDMAMLPARHLRDARDGGCLEAAFRALDAGARAALSGGDAAAKHGALAAVAGAWADAGLYAPPAVWFDDGVDPAVAAELGTVAAELGATLANSPAEATHVVRHDSDVDDAPDDGAEYLKTLVVDARRRLALVHWWYLPDSKDEWIPLERVEGAGGAIADASAWSRPAAAASPPWRVCERFLRDAAKFREFGSEADYQPEDDEEEVAEPAAKAARKAGSGSKKKRKRDGDGRRKFKPRPLPNAPALPPSQRPDRTYEVVKAVIDVVDTEDGGVTVNLSHRVEPPPVAKPAAAPAAAAAPAPAAAAPPAPARARAFDPAKVTDVEMACCPEWFCGDAAKTPARYLETRNWMISQYATKPQQLLTATACRQRLGVDAASALRLFAFLDAWGLVNGGVPPSARRVAKAPALAPRFFTADAAPAAPWPRHRTAALLRAVRDRGGDFAAAAADLSAAGEPVDAAECATRFVQVPLDGAAALLASEAPPPAPAAPAAPGGDAAEGPDDARACAALDELIDVRLRRLEARVAELSRLDRHLAEEQAAAARERARLQTEWADLAINLE